MDFDEVENDRSSKSFFFHPQVPAFIRNRAKIKDDKILIPNLKKNQYELYYRNIRLKERIGNNEKVSVIDSHAVGRQFCIGSK